MRRAKPKSTGLASSAGETNSTNKASPAGSDDSYEETSPGLVHVNPDGGALICISIRPNQTGAGNRWIVGEGTQTECGR